MSVKPVNGECPEGYRWNPIKKECEKIPSRTGNCPEGYVWDYESQSCVEDTPEYREKGLLFTLRFMESKGFSKEDIELMAKSKNLYTGKIKEFVDGLKGVGEKSVEEDNIEDAPIQITTPTTTKSTEVKQPTTTEPPAPAKQLTEDEKKEQEKKLQLRNQRVSEYSKEIEALKNDTQISQSSRFDGILYRKQKELQDKLNSEFPPEQLGVGSNDFIDSFRVNQSTTNATPTSTAISTQPVIPPANPQGQVEFMQQQAQQMPVPNEVSSRTQLPQMTGGIPEAEQQVGMQEEVPQDNGSIFQRLRNLFSGKSPQPPQPSIAPQTTQQQPVDNRIMRGGAGMNATALDNIAYDNMLLTDDKYKGGSGSGFQNNKTPGQYTGVNSTGMDMNKNARSYGEFYPIPGKFAGGAGDGSAVNEMIPKEFQNAQNLGQQATQPGMFGGGKGDGGSMGQSATTGLSGAFANAGESPIGTTGAVAGTTNVNTGALPEEVVKPAQTTGTQVTGGGQVGGQVGGQTTGQVGGQVGGQVTGQTGTQPTGVGTPPPPFATPGIVGGGMGNPLVNVLNNQVVETVNEKGQKSKSMQDLIEIGGTGFDDEVLARKLRRQAAMPDLKNEDYYPNEPFTQAQTAWGDPIFSGAGALFPMAAYDAQRRARAQAELDEAKRNVMQIKIPEVKTAAYYQKVRSDFTNEVTGVVNEAVKRFGGNNQKAMRHLRESGLLAQIENKYNGLAMNIDQFADEANAFLKGARENPNKLYYSLEGVKAGNNFLAGMNAFNNGEITAEQLNGLREKFQTAETWSNYLGEKMKVLTADEKVPTAEQVNNPTQEDDFAFRKVQPNGTPADFQTWLFVKKYTDLNKDKVLQSIVLPFISQNPLAMEQLADPNETPDQTANRIAESIVALRGQEIEVGQREYNPSGRNTTIVNFNPTGGEKGMGFHESTLLSEAQIRDNLNKNRQNKALTNEQLVDQSFGGSWRARPNDPYVRASVPGQIYDASTTPLRYSDYLQPTGISGQGSPDRQWNTIDQKDLDTIGAKSTSETPKFAKIVGVEMSWAVRDPKTNQWNMVTADNLKKYGMPPNAKMVIVEQNLLYNEPGEEVSTTFESPDGSKMTTPAGTEKGPRKAIKAVRVLEATPQNIRFYDDITNPTRSNEGAYGVPKSGTATTPSTGQNISIK